MNNDISQFWKYILLRTPYFFHFKHTGPKIHQSYYTRPILGPNFRFLNELGLETSRRWTIEGLDNDFPKDFNIEAWLWNNLYEGTQVRGTSILSKNINLNIWAWNCIYGGLKVSDLAIKSRPDQLFRVHVIFGQIDVWAVITRSIPCYLKWVPRTKRPPNIQSQDQGTKLNLFAISMCRP